MKYTKLVLFFLILPLLAFTSLHKYYISVTQIEFVPEQQSVQIISRLFLDDFENVLKQRYDEKITLDEAFEIPNTNSFINKYLADKLQITINGKPATFQFIGKKYDLDVMKCYLEIKNVKTIESIQVSNKILFDMFPDQQNIIKTKINSKQKSFIQTVQNANALLNFNEN
ncbi:peptidase E [Seonamhaeicola algicola]|uniref:Peptidase E n=1 Tax=Seonamhaeicola algicola TaxID=1719036 RepID=A0A5C7AEC6_9FLAO|nr:DUF6702 family protein [Seonamhaeicola algicola]TXE07160.1 peptidase E [Seonamhaeicola algicola]